LKGSERGVGGGGGEKNKEKSKDTVGEQKHLKSNIIKKNLKIIL